MKGKKWCEWSSMVVVVLYGSLFHPKTPRERNKGNMRRGLPGPGRNNTEEQVETFIN